MSLKNGETIITETQTYENQTFNAENDLNIDEIRNEEKIEMKTLDTLDNANIDSKDVENKDDENEAVFITELVTKIKTRITQLWKKVYSKKLLCVVFIFLYSFYFALGMYLNYPFNFPSNVNSTILLNDYIFSNNKGLALFCLTVIVSLLLLWDNFLCDYLATNVKLELEIFNNAYYKKYGSWITILAWLSICVIYLFQSLSDWYNLVSLGGVIAYILICILISFKPSKINWKILVSGILFQFTVGVFLMRVEFGYKLFKFLGEQVTTFLGYTNRGSQLVFGEKYTDHYFAFAAAPVILFFGAIINLFYYLGFVQYVILKISWIFATLLRTSPTESMNATANIFLGQTEAPLLIQPFLPSMTESEIFSVMTSGFASVAGSTLAAYIGFGVPPNHLIIASLMAAPASLAVSKTIFPETKKTKANMEAIRNLPKIDASNFFEAIATGAINVLTPIGCILANLIAFSAIFAFLDSVVAWFFSQLNLENFGLISIMQYLFFPFAFLMGVKSEDCKVVSGLIGTKIFVNEFVAYSELGKMIQFRNQIIKENLFESYRNGTLHLPQEIGSMIWNDRSIVVSTYALCGFANFASVGLQIGGLSALAPSRFQVFSAHAAKAMIAGNITNFLSACIAGLLFAQL